MKKQIIIFLALISSMMTFSQGIEFEHGTWKELLEKAQQVNKPIFVDVFTTWCGPCKMMSKDIFPQEEVGKFFNSNFVNYKLDAEKGDGTTLAKKYGVTAYPTYLFLKPDGTLFFKALGSMDAKAFIEKGKNALAEASDSKPINVWENEYEAKKTNPDFLIEYMEKRSILGMSNLELLEQYLQLLPESERATTEVMEMYDKEQRNIKINTLLYNNLIKNRAAFDKHFSAKRINQLLYNVVFSSVRTATKTKNTELLADAMKAYEILPEDARAMSKDELYMLYYEKTAEKENYLIHATNHCNSLMKISDQAIQQKDKENLQQFNDMQKRGAFNKSDSSEIAEIKNYFFNAERNRITAALNAIAWKIFQENSDSKALKLALNWSKRTIVLSPENGSLLDTYANITYKIGQKKKAIALEEKALQKTVSEEIKTGLQETLRKMKAGEKTWNN